MGGMNQRDRRATLGKKKGQRYIHGQHQPPIHSRKNDRSDSTLRTLPNRPDTHDRSDSTLPRRPVTHDVDCFFQSYQKWWRGAEIWLVLALGNGATLELKTHQPCRLTLTNDNILAALLAWDNIMGGQAAPQVRLLYHKLQRHQKHFVLSEGNLRLLLKTMATCRFDVGQDIVLDLREVFCHEEQTILSDTACRELQIIRHALFPSRRIHFEVRGRDGPFWWIKSIESVQHFCHLVFPSSTTTTAPRAAGLVFSYSSVAEKDWVQWCTAQQHLLRWLEAHQPGVPVLLRFSYRGTPTTALNFSGVQLACYLQRAMGGGRRRGGVCQRRRYFSYIRVQAPMLVV
jgi:hypothetical protein